MEHRGWVIAGEDKIGPVFRTREHLEAAWPGRPCQEAVSPKEILFVPAGARHGHNYHILPRDFPTDDLIAAAAAGYKVIRRA